jgi:intraflagellar transport protein 74
MRQQPIGVGLATDVKVTERPVTQQGVMGMTTGKFGPGRQIYDKSYYMLNLRTKLSEIQNELQKFKTEIDNIQNENNLYSKYEKRYDELIKSVRNLEGDLADYNLALDKQRTDTRPEEVQHMYFLLKGQNDQQRQDLDAIFLEKKHHEEEIRKIEEEIGMIRKQAEDRLNELHPDAREEYENLQEENSRLNQELSSARMDLDRVNTRLATAQGRLQSDVLRMRAQQQRETLAELMERHSKLKEEADTLKLSIPEQRELLVAKVKAENAEINAAEKTFGELKKEIQRYKKQAQEMETDINERKGESTDQHKYEILFSKDQEMSQFIEGFDEAKKEEEEQMAQKQRRITQLLTETSKMIKRGDKMPDQKHVREMEEQLEFKGEELKNSEITAVRLRTELDRRSGELDKINSLDNKISTELQQLDTKMKQFKNDIETKYNHVDRAKEDGENMLRQLDVRRDAMMEKVKVMKLQVTAKKLQYDSLKQQLADNETHKALEAQEGKLRQIQKSVLYLSTYCASKSGESDYSGMQRNVLDLVESVNQHLQKQMLQPYSAGAI